MIAFYTYIESEDGALILIDKPKEWTSFDVIKKIRNCCKEKKIGHAGTLDPLATGLLILCTGKLTKKTEYYQAKEKEYEGEMLLGQTTPSYDLETAVDAYFPIEHINENIIKEKSQAFTGTLMQTPPMYSAVKIDGKKLYEVARKGKAIEVKPRPITIYDFEIRKVEMPYVAFKVVCSKGTYIRSLVHDFGKALNSGAVLTSLRRTRIGHYHVSDAASPQEFCDWYKSVKK
ncbi:MAG: tRNA pseudouridine(55) synthase TruB [Cytophagaceae bacterium]|nr:tRNA pseudouridine(55) synthase TruB [Cytophagaceae bacterium]MDW8455840.1 tRNA pseudouridine(55) synthase TruB [Cytophagaceae bacterium]